MTYELDYVSAEREGCSSKIVFEVRAFYVRLLSSPEGAAKYFVADTDGHLQKEISKSEFELWVNILADNDSDVNIILERVMQGKKY
jgi:hypothetical protein